MSAGISRRMTLLKRVVMSCLLLAWILLTFGRADPLSGPLQQRVDEVVAGEPQCGDRATGIGARRRLVHREDLLRDQRAVGELDQARARAERDRARVGRAERLA